MGTWVTKIVRGGRGWNSQGLHMTLVGTLPARGGWGYNSHGMRQAYDTGVWGMTLVCRVCKSMMTTQGSLDYNASLPSQSLVRCHCHLIQVFWMYMERNITMEPMFKYVYENLSIFLHSMLKYLNSTTSPCQLSWRTLIFCLKPYNFLSKTIFLRQLLLFVATTKNSPIQSLDTFCRPEQTWNLYKLSISRKGKLTLLVSTQGVVT